MGNDDDRQPKNEAYKATAAMDYAPQGVTATTPAFAHILWATLQINALRLRLSEGYHFTPRQMCNPKHIQPPLRYSLTQQTTTAKKKREGTFHVK